MMQALRENEYRKEPLINCIKCGIPGNSFIPAQCMDKDCPGVKIS